MKQRDKDRKKSDKVSKTGSVSSTGEKQEKRVLNSKELNDQALPKVSKEQVGKGEGEGNLH
jgi:hypothetical protein